VKTQRSPLIRGYTFCHIFIFFQENPLYVKMNWSNSKLEHSIFKFSAIRVNRHYCNLICQLVFHVITSTLFWPFHDHWDQPAWTQIRRRLHHYLIQIQAFRHSGISFTKFQTNQPRWNDQADENSAYLFRRLIRFTWFNYVVISINTFFIGTGYHFNDSMIV